MYVEPNIHSILPNEKIEFDNAILLEVICTERTMSQIKDFIQTMCLFPAKNGNILSEEVEYLRHGEIYQNRWLFDNNLFDVVFGIRYRIPYNTSMDCKKGEQVSRLNAFIWKNRLVFLAVDVNGENGELYVNGVPFAQNVTQVNVVDNHLYIRICKKIHGVTNYSVRCYDENFKQVGEYDGATILSMRHPHIVVVQCGTFNFPKDIASTRYYARDGTMLCEISYSQFVCWHGELAVESRTIPGANGKNVYHLIHREFTEFKPAQVVTTSVDTASVNTTSVNTTSVNTTSVDTTSVDTTSVDTTSVQSQSHDADVIDEHKLLKELVEARAELTAAQNKFDAKKKAVDKLVKQLENSLGLGL